MKIFLNIIIIIFFYISNSFLKVTNGIQRKYYKKYKYQDKSIFKIVHPTGYWKDSN